MIFQIWHYKKVKWATGITHDPIECHDLTIIHVHLLSILVLWRIFATFSVAITFAFRICNNAGWWIHQEYYNSRFGTWRNRYYVIWWVFWFWFTSDFGATHCSISKLKRPAGSQLHVVKCYIISFPMSNSTQLVAWIGFVGQDAKETK